MLLIMLITLLSNSFKFQIAIQTYKSNCDQKMIGNLMRGSEANRDATQSLIAELFNCPKEPLNVSRQLKSMGFV